MNEINNIFKDKVILITGHTGFKGSWLTLWLKELGAKIIGYSNDIPSTPSTYEVLKLKEQIIDYREDITDIEKLRNVIGKHNPDFIFHLAAQPLVKNSYEDPLMTIETNAIGSSKLLEVIRNFNKPVTVIMVTSDKVYENNESNKGYIESDRLGGGDPYSASKAMTELAINTYIKSFFNESDSLASIGIVRAGNVIGGGDWAFNRIVPDCIRAWSDDKNVIIRNPQATRPWQHVLEPLSGYLSLASNLYKNKKNHGEAFNFGPSIIDNHTVEDLLKKMSLYWKNVSWKLDNNQTKQKENIRRDNKKPE